MTFVPNPAIAYFRRSFCALALLFVFNPALAENLTDAEKVLCAPARINICVDSGDCASILPWEVNVPQSKDESECYNWAVSNTGTDPFQLSREASAQQQQAAQAQQQASQTGQNEAGRGLLRGAAAGALIGEIADDDAGKGAAWGAAVGVTRGARRGREQRREAEYQAEQYSQSQQQAIANQGQNFKKAFSVCLEAKNYMVKY